MTPEKKEALWRMIVIAIVVTIAALSVAAYFWVLVITV